MTLTPDEAEADDLADAPIASVSTPTPTLRNVANLTSQAAFHDGHKKEEKKKNCFSQVFEKS
jgi:hypothetical protein